MKTACIESSVKSEKTKQKTLKTFSDFFTLPLSPQVVLLLRMFAVSEHELLLWLNPQREGVSSSHQEHLIKSKFNV